MLQKRLQQNWRQVRGDFLSVARARLTREPFGFTARDMAKMLSHVEKAVREWNVEISAARQHVGHFLLKNGFEMDANSKKQGIWSLTYPLHEAVKQREVYIISKLLLFGATPFARDHWGRVPFDYAQGHREVIEVFERYGCAPHSPGSRPGILHRSPPPEGFERFFARVAKDPLVVSNSEATWLQHRGPRSLRTPPKREP